MLTQPRRHSNHDACFWEDVSDDDRFDIFFPQEARGVYIYFLAKISELLDTVFFVLRKKDRQISFLHMYHHTVMPMISWGATKYYPGGHGTFIGKCLALAPAGPQTEIRKFIDLTLTFCFSPGTINSFVHIIMYSYYFLSALGPQLQPYLWWKKHITNMQMVSSVRSIRAKIKYDTL